MCNLHNLALFQKLLVAHTNKFEILQEEYQISTTFLEILEKMV